MIQCRNPNELTRTRWSLTALSAVSIVAAGCGSPATHVAQSQADRPILLSIFVKSPRTYVVNTDGSSQLLTVNGRAIEEARYIGASSKVQLLAGDFFVGALDPGNPNPGQFVRQAISYLARDSFSDDGSIGANFDETGVMVFRGSKTLLNLSNARLRGPITDAQLSPDGELVAISVSSGKPYHEGGESFGELYIASVTGKELRRVGIGSNPQWSHDGKYVAALEGPSSGGRSILRYKASDWSVSKLIQSAQFSFERIAYGRGGDLAFYGEYEGKSGLFVLEHGKSKPNLLISERSLGTFTHPPALEW